MTVSATDPVVQYAYSATGDYTFNFRVYEDTDLALSIIASSGVVVPLVIGALNDYTVTLVDEVDGGTCHLTSVLTGTLDIRRNLPFTQEIDWVNNSPFDMDLLEEGMDRAVMLLQQMEVLVQGAAIVTNWRGDWAGLEEYAVSDIVTAPNTNWYSCAVAHTSTGTFADDLALGYWIIALDVEVVSAYADAAAASAAASEASAVASAASAVESADSAVESAGSAVESANSAAAAASSANFVGEWGTLTGALNIPSSVIHDGVLYTLLVNLVDVTLSEPGVTADWALSTALPYQLYYLLNIT